MRYQQLRCAMLTQFAQPGGNLAAYFVIGAPGGGKSALARDVAYTHLRNHGVEPNDTNVIEFNASLRDPVDIMGTPRNADGVTDWIPPREFYNISADVQGDKPCFLILEELSDAPMAMQNPMCRVIYDRCAGQLRLAPNLYIIATGNRTSDKSGANRISTKLGNRVRMHEFNENLDDWCDWAAKNAVDPLIIQFLRWRPNFLSDFSPERYSNPTPRSWADVNRIPVNQTSDIFMAEVASCVSEGPAAEYVAFRKVADALKPFEEYIKKPKTIEIPSEVSAKYAVVGMLTSHVNPDNASQVALFIKRLELDFQTMFWVDTMKRVPGMLNNPDMLEWIRTSGKSIVQNN